MWSDIDAAAFPLLPCPSTLVGLNQDLTPVVFSTQWHAHAGEAAHACRAAHALRAAHDTILRQDNQRHSTFLQTSPQQVRAV